jgi:hypothetical protein
MAKGQSKKTKAKGGKAAKGASKSATSAPTKRKQDEKVLADLELRDDELDQATGGATLATTSNTNLSTNLKDTTIKVDLSGGPGINRLDALNLGLY